MARNGYSHILKTHWNSCLKFEYVIGPYQKLSEKKYFDETAKKNPVFLAFWAKIQIFWTKQEQARVAEVSRLPTVFLAEKL